MKQTENEMNVNVPLEVIKASEIEPKEVKWLWYPYIPFGKVTLLQGVQIVGLNGHLCHIRRTV